MKTINFTTVEELLTSEDFLKWYQQTDEKEIQVWNQWIAESTEHQRLVNEAIQLLGLIRSKEDNGREKEVNEEIDRLLNTIRHEKDI